ncbi:hypothetical protein BC937DRAFT_94483 [Endogone sp. FLAS-F59071]|nr:hypothetical protein BC937DRAFT_94483 [Endogone sp. FLAS-F59071]|eukprot:RUS20745.1 hypothetical protein BC937DRAFT_94483 [Endogone sp. FLAS-F59071]
MQPYSLLPDDDDDDEAIDYTLVKTYASLAADPTASFSLGYSRPLSIQQRSLVLSNSTNDKDTIPESPPFRSVDRHLRKVSANECTVELYPYHSDPAISSFSWDTSQGDEDEVHFVLGSQESAAGAGTQETHSSPRVSHVRSDETDIGDTSTVFSSPPHKTSFYSPMPNLTYTPQSGSSEPQWIANSHRQIPVVVIPTLHSTNTTPPSTIRLPADTILPLHTHSTSLDTVGALVAPLSLVSSSASSQLTSSLFSAAPIRTLRRRRDVQLRPFTVEKERYRASISRNISELADLDEVRDESQHHRRKRGRKSDSMESDHYSEDSHNYGNVCDTDQRHRPPMEELKGKGSWNPARGATHDSGEIANVRGKENQMPARTSSREGTTKDYEQMTQTVDRRQSSRKRNNDGIEQDDSGISANVVEPRIRRSRIVYRASVSGYRSGTKRPTTRDTSSITSSSQPMASPSIQNYHALNGNKSTGASRVDEELLKWREELENDDELDIAKEIGPLVSKQLSPSSISVSGFHSNMSDTDGLDEVASPFAQERMKKQHGDRYSNCSNDLSQDKESDDDNAITICPTRRRIVQYRNGHKRVTKARDVNAKRLKGALPASFVTLNRDALDRESQNNTEHIPYHRSRTPSDQVSSASRSSSASPDMRLPSLPPPLSHRAGNAYSSQNILGDRSRDLQLTLASNDIFTDEENDGSQSQGSDREDSPNYMDTMRSLSPSLAKYQSVNSSDEDDADTPWESDPIDRMVTRRSTDTTKRKSREVNGLRKNISRNTADKLLRKRPYSEHSRRRQSTVTIVGKDTQTILDNDDRVLTNLSELSPDHQSISVREANSNIKYINNEIVPNDMARDDRIWLESDTDSADNKGPLTSSPKEPTELRTMTRALSMKLKSKSRLRPRSSNGLFKPPQQKSVKTFFTTNVQRNRTIRRTTVMKHSRKSSSMSHQRFKSSASHAGRFGETARNLQPRNTEANETVIDGTTEIGSNGLTMSVVQHTTLTSRKPRWVFMDDPRSSGLPDQQQAEWVTAMMKSRIDAQEKIGAISRNGVLNKFNTHIGFYKIHDLDNRNVERRVHDTFENTEPTSLTDFDKNEFPENAAGVSWIEKEHRSLKPSQHVALGDGNDDLEIVRNSVDHATQLRNKRRRKQRNLSRVADVEHSHTMMSFEKPLHATSEQIPMRAIKLHQSSSSRRPLGYSVDSNYDSTKFNRPSELVHPPLQIGSRTPNHNGGTSEHPIGRFSLSDFLSRQNELSGDFGVCPIPGGIYFRRNTYIGRGSLKTLIRQPHALYSLADGNQMDLFSDIVGNGVMRIFDSQITLATSWQEITSLLPKLFYQAMDNIMSILQSERRSLNEASQSHKVDIEDSVKESLALECIAVVDSVTTFITYRVPFLSVADRTKFKSVLATECACLWRRFKAMFDSDIFYQNGNHLDQFHSYRLAIRLCCGFVDWAARLSLMECTVEHEEFSVYSQSKELMRLLLRSGSTGIQRSLRRSLIATVVEEALLEGWVLLINVMDRYASTWRLRENGYDDQHPPVEESSFWTILNELVVEKPVVDTNDDPWSRSEQAWNLMFAILPLYQFDVNVDGVSNAQPDGIGNWSFVEKLLRESFVPPDDVRSMTIAQQIAYDRYVKVLFHRCHTLVLSWSWRADKEILKPLYKFFECRKFKDLLFEEDASFPEFFQNFTGEILPEISSSDTCFHILLKILYITFDRECADIKRMETNSSTKREQALRKLLSQLSPTHVMTLKESPDENAGGMVLSPGGHSYTSLGNQYNLILLMAHAIPSGIWPRSITQMKSFLKFEDSDLISRRIFFEAFSLLAIIYKHHDDPLQDIFDYMNEKLIYICTEYLERERGRNIAVIPSPFHNIRKTDGTLDKYMNGLQTQEARTQLDSSQKELLQLIETVFIYYTKILQAPATKAMSTIWPDASFLNQGWKVILNPDEAFPPTARLRVLNFINDLFATRSQKTTVITSQIMADIVEDSQDSDAALFDNFDYSALNAELALLEQVPYTSKRDQADRLLAEAVNAWLADCLRNLMTPNLKPEYRYNERYGLNDKLLSVTVECFAECALILVAHKMRSWDDYLLSPWMLKGNKVQERKIRLLFMKTVSEMDAAPIQAYEDQFLAVWFQTIVETKISFQHLYTNALLNLPKPPDIFFNLPVTRSRSNMKYNLDEYELKEIRPALIAAILSNMGDGFRKCKAEAPQDSWILKRKFQDYLRHLFVSLREIYQAWQSSRT